MDIGNDPVHEWLTVQEFARIFRVSDRTVVRWVASDPNMRVRRIGPSGRTIRIHRSELNREPSLPATA
jgi:excisionase family DNA binding protein